MLYSSAESRRRIEVASRVAGKLGLQIIAQEVEEPKDLPGALATLGRRADLIWALSDAGVVTRETTKPLLLFSFRNRIPFVGLSSAWVKAGALYSLERDYEDLGAQCAELAEKIHRGAAAASLPVARPRKVLLSLNVRTADHMKVELPQPVVDSADRLYR